MESSPGPVVSPHGGVKRCANALADVESRHTGRAKRAAPGSAARERLYVTSDAGSQVLRRFARRYALDFAGRIDVP